MISLDEEFTLEDIKYLSEAFTKQDLEYIKKFNKSNSSFFNLKKHGNNSLKRI